MEGDLEAESDYEHAPSQSFLGCTACSVSQLLSPLAHDMSAYSLLTNMFTVGYLPKSYTHCLSNIL